MKALSHITSNNNSRKTALSVVNPTAMGNIVGKVMAPSGIATECIKSSIATPGEWAIALNLKSERTVQRWRSGAERIPRERISQIIFAAKGFMMKLNPLQVWIDEALICQYGPSAQIQQEKGWLD